MSLAQCKNKSQHKKKYINPLYMECCVFRKGCREKKLHVRIKTYFEMNKAMTKSRATRMKKMPNKIQEEKKRTHNKLNRVTFQNKCDCRKNPCDLKNTVFAEGVHSVSHHKRTVVRVVKGRPYGPAGPSLATVLKGDRRKEWHSPDRAGRHNQPVAGAKGKKEKETGKNIQASNMHIKKIKNENQKKNKNNVKQDRAARSTERGELIDGDGICKILIVLKLNGR